MFKTGGDDLDMYSQLTTNVSASNLYMLATEDPSISLFVVNMDSQLEHLLANDFHGQMPKLVRHLFSNVSDKKALTDDLAIPCFHLQPPLSILPLSNNSDTQVKELFRCQLGHYSRIDNCLVHSLSGRTILIHNRFLIGNHLFITNRSYINRRHRNNGISSVDLSGGLLLLLPPVTLLFPSSRAIFLYINKSIGG